MRLIFRKIMSFFYKILMPRFSSLERCERCGRTSNVGKDHLTIYALGKGCFPLCEDCWQKLEPETRLPYYRKSFEKWEHNYANWDDVKKAVMEGK